MHGGRLILIVDDDRSHRFMLATVLSNMGYGICEASDGTVAVETIRKQNIDLVLMDIHMKKLSGIEALEEIKVFNPRMPVLLMTAYCSKEDEEEAQKKGAVSILNKPLNLSDLHSEIDLALMQSRACFKESRENH